MSFFSLKEQCFVDFFNLVRILFSVFFYLKLLRLDANSLIVAA